MTVYIKRVTLPKWARISFVICAVLMGVGLIGYWFPIAKSGNWPSLDLNSIFMLIFAPIGFAGVTGLAIKGQLVSLTEKRNEDK